MKYYSQEIINRILSLRKNGKTYKEINKIIGKEIPKSTLSYLCKKINLSPNYRIKIQKRTSAAGVMGLKIAREINRLNREKYLNAIKERVLNLSNKIKDRNVSKIALAMLYLGEGGKTRSSIMFGNSDPETVKLFLSLLRFSYNVDENKFRCTLQCRADQNIRMLEKYWLKLTRIPKRQLYKTQIDRRTIGKTAKKLDYKGVCRIDYFSSEILNELKMISKVIAESFH